MDMEGNPERSSNDDSDTSWHASQPEIMSPTAGIQSSDTTLAQRASGQVYNKHKTVYFIHSGKCSKGGERQQSKD